jgi:hypothetical protein
MGRLEAASAAVSRNHNHGGGVDLGQLQRRCIRSGGSQWPVILVRTGNQQGLGRRKDGQMGDRN